MVDEEVQIDGFEEAARIVEAFADCESGPMFIILTEIASAIRDRALSN